MKTPTAQQVDQGAMYLATLAQIGNSRPGDGWLSMESQREQFRIRALDMLTIILNAPDILGLVEAPAPAADAWRISLRNLGWAAAGVLALAAAYALGAVAAIGVMGA